MENDYIDTELEELRSVIGEENLSGRRRLSDNA